MKAVAPSAFLMSLISMIALLPMLKLVAPDIPNHRSSHVHLTPRGGGVAVMLGLALGVAIGAWRGYDLSLILLVGLVSMTLLGLADDLSNLGARVRLCITLLVCAAAAVVVIDPENAGSIAAVAVAALFLGGYTNAFNFMDGVNGISALNAALTGGWFAFLAYRQDAGAAMVLALSIAGASLGFLPWNAPKARVFLGDSGSYGLGFAISVSALVLWRADAPVALVLAPLWIYVVDTFTAFARRLFAGRDWSEAHREHVYQRLVDGGLAHFTSSFLVAFLSAVACAFAWFTREQGAVMMIAGAALIAAVYLTLPPLLSRRGGGVSV